MVSTPYRLSAAERSVTPAAAPLTPPSIAGVVVALWGATLLRLAVACHGGETWGRELTLAWLVFLLAPVVIATELMAYRRARGASSGARARA